MRHVPVSEIRQCVRDLCIEANTRLRPDILKALKYARASEHDARAKRILGSLIENASIARKRRLAICQDTGMVVVFIEVGQDVRFEGGDLSAAIQEGVREGYQKGYFRKSVVEDPLMRTNTKTNTPCIVYTDIGRGDRVRITVTPKGFGSENKSAIRMFNPTDGAEEIKRFVLDVVKRAGPDACPPFVIGIGMGGTFDHAAVLSKRALARSVAIRNKKRHIARLERDLCAAINKLRIGPMGLGGDTTALGVNIEAAPTHIAGFPVAVNVSCHATRGAQATV